MMMDEKKTYTIRAERFVPDEVIFREGEPGTKMYVLLRGEVDLSVRGKNIATLKKGDILGEMAIIDNEPRSATAIAKSDSELVVIDEERFLALVHERPGFAIEVMRVLVKRLRTTDEVIRGEMGP
jgi:CRP-like cAMP-binding protein